MHLTKDHFDRACREAALDPAQADNLWRLLSQLTPAATPDAPSNPRATGGRFDLAHLAYYLGAMIVLGAMGWFMTSAWEAFGGAGIFSVAVSYAVGFAWAGWSCWRRPDPALRTPGGLLVTLAVGMMPLAIYGLERWLGWWPTEDPGDYARFHVWVNGGWLVMELGTVAAGIIALRFVRFPFLTAPIAFALWYLSMDTTPLLFGRQDWGWDERLLVSIYFGLAMLAAAYVVDVRRRWQGPDYGFWLSLFGLLSFWLGLTLLNSHSEAGKLGYAFVNVLLLGSGVVLDRRACVVFGALGLNWYLGHLAYDLFRDSLLFPLVLSLFGLGIIVAGVIYQRQRSKWRAAILQRLPERYTWLVPILRLP